MKKALILVALVVLFVFTTGGIVYQKAADDTYEGMTIIPEQHKDIPLFPGLEPQKSDYFLKGDHWTAVYSYYLKNMEKHGWTLVDSGSALDDNDKSNDWSGFRTRWHKSGFKGDLWISGSYNQRKKETEVVFDKTASLKASTWLDARQTDVSLNNAFENKLLDGKDGEKAIHFINSAPDYNRPLPEEVMSAGTIIVGDERIDISYDQDHTIYFRSEKGTKFMKPDPEFLKLIHLNFD